MKEEGGFLTVSKKLNAETRVGRECRPIEEKYPTAAADPFTGAKGR
jgi:hypothetical protein